MIRWLPAIARGRDLQGGVIYAGFLAIFLFFAFTLHDDGFLTTRNLSNIVLQTAPATVMAIGFVFVLSAGEIDLSFGSITAVSALSAAVVMQNHSMLFGILAGLGAGLAIGFFNGAMVAWLRLRPAVSGRRISEVGALFKAAVLDRHQRIHGQPPAVLHGHGFVRPGYDLARYLALPDTGHSRSRGRIHGLALWLPPDSDRVQRQMARDAAIAIDALVGQGIEVSVNRTEMRSVPGLRIHAAGWGHRPAG